MANYETKIEQIQKYILRIEMNPNTFSRQECTSIYNLLNKTREKIPKDNPAYLKLLNLYKQIIHIAKTHGMELPLILEVGADQELQKIGLL